MRYDSQEVESRRRQAVRRTALGYLGMAVVLWGLSYGQLAASRTVDFVSENVRETGNYLKSCSFGFLEDKIKEE